MLLRCYRRSVLNNLRLKNTSCPEKSILVAPTYFIINASNSAIRSSAPANCDSVLSRRSLSAVGPPFATAGIYGWCTGGDGGGGDVFNFNNIIFVQRAKQSELLTGKTCGTTSHT